VSGPDRRAESGPRHEERRRSHAAIPATIVVVLVGLVLGGYTLVAPLVLGGALLVSGFSLFSSRVNPLSAHFYSSRKPSFSAIGVVFLGALVLLWYTYYLWTTRLGGLWPHL
jgi:xanthine/uracil permease